MIQDTVSVHQEITLTVFLLKILWSLLDLGKCLSNKLRNVFAAISGDTPTKRRVGQNDVTTWFSFLSIFFFFVEF